AIGKAAAALVLALLERLLGLARRGFAAHRQPSLRPATAAAPATVLAQIVEAAQLAPLVGGGHVAVHVPGRGPVASGQVDRRLGRPALADHRLQGQRRRRTVLEAEVAPQLFDPVGRKLDRLSAQQFARQCDLAVADALEPADLAALRLPQPADLAVAAFLDHDPEPVVGVAAADPLDLVEPGRAVFQRHAATQPVDDRVGNVLEPLGRAHPADVLALVLVRGVHEGVGEFAVGGQQQQAGGVDVQPADRDPARALQRRQRVEDGRPALGVFAGGDLALGLVVHQHARRFGQGAGDELAAVDLHLVAAADADANLRDLAVDLDQAVGDALFQCTPRTEAGLGEHLVQALFEPGGGGGSAALEGQFVAGLLVH